MIQSSLSPVSQDQRPVRVLIVDDSPQVRHDLRQYLDLIGNMKVVGEAADGHEAIRFAGELSPDAIIMDLEMPGMDGFDATQQIKARGLASRVIILSMHASPEDVARARSVGADEFVVKGADFEKLIDAILGRSNSPDPMQS